MFTPRFGSPGRAPPRFMPAITKRVGRASLGLVVLALTSLLLTSHLFFSLVSSIAARRPSHHPVLRTTSAFHPVSLPANTTAAALCASFPSHLLTSRSVQPVLKMGHGENPSQIAAQLATVSSCFSPEDLLVFSDLDQPLGRDHHAINILAYLPEAYHLENPDLDAYNALQALLQDGEEDVDRARDPTAKTGWKTDKYKFLLLIERAWALKPGRAWYVFYETDTYLVWDNVFRLLSLLDPTEPVYLGSPSPGREGTFFANGGPGFVLSRAAMERLLSRQGGGESLVMRGMEMVKGDCCGDSVLGWMLWEAGVRVSGLFPMFSPWAGEGTPYTERAWCQPVVSMHKTGAGDVERLWRWEFEGRREGVSLFRGLVGFGSGFADNDGGQRPLLFADLFEFYQVAGQETREDWDNSIWDRLAQGRDVPGDSVEACVEACEADETCLQYLWRGEKAKQCVLMPYISHGRKRADETATGGFRFLSGWMVERIEAWKRRNTCGEDAWVSPSTERIY